MRRVEGLQSGLRERTGALSHCVRGLHGMPREIEAGVHPASSVHCGALIVFQRVKSGADELRLLAFHQLKNQHEAKSFQPNARLFLVIIGPVEDRVVQIEFHGIEK